MGPPGQHREGVQIRAETLVGFLNADKALDGAAVQHNLIVQRPLKLGDGDGHVLHLAENIRKLHADELNVLLLYHSENIFLAESAHKNSLLSTESPHFCVVFQDSAIKRRI
ncbi:hypothetical protein SDC9_124506 [bioreactor metagenome]|uniref:Uncharacterized protein n=1 Tax=bioreactor metagenome TaxID=1076179 RepID=A0A645CKJ7_9ZZZZ